MEYKIISQIFVEELAENIIRINDDDTETVIPTDPANSDYQAYLAWLEEQA